MRQWDILLFPFHEELPHPAVILSNDERCENADLEVVKLLAQSLQDHSVVPIPLTAHHRI